MDVSAVGPFTNVGCPNCGELTRVKREFGPYTLLRRHAVGGMSMVFAAKDNTLGREVALKILSEEYSANERRIAAFEEEARLTASFSHPNVVRVLTTGRAFGRFYIAMEFVPGGHFEHQINERGNIPELELLPIAIEVAQGLKAAHAAGLIHRDVKPGNILLDAEGHAKLVDFGLALVTHGGKAQATEMWATPYYVPPETVEGHPEDFRSDIYAFGATIYHALAGIPPCGEESMATDILREAKKHIVPLATAETSVSQETCQIVDKAMAYDPKARFSSYEELISNLEAALISVKSGRSQTPTTAARRRLEKKRKERLLIGGSLLTFAAVAAVLYFAWRATQTKPQQTTEAPAVKITVPPPVAPDSSAEIGKAYQDAHASLEAREYDKAAIGFITLHRNPAVQEPTRTWVGIEAVLATLLDGHSTEARKLAPDIVKHVKALPPEAVHIPSNLIETLSKLGEPSTLAAPSAVDPAAGGASRMITCMLAGLKNWEQGKPDPAAACFNAAAAVKLQQEDGWSGFYQKVAEDYLADYQILSSPLFNKQPTERAECEAAVKKLETVLTTVKTKGRMHFDVRAWQLDLTRSAKLAGMAKPTDPVQQAPVENTATDPANALTKLNEFSHECRFAEATTYLKSLPQDPPGASRSSLLTVAEWSAVFLSDITQDLAKEPVTHDLQLKSGETVESISLNAGGVLTLTLPGGSTRPCAWGELSPDTLIAMHRAFVKNSTNPLERLRRNECAIAFEWLAGNRERALAAAANLSQSSPVFKQHWDSITDGLPK